ncbi:DUF47 domain-containing protein [Azospirillum sp. ST 5-10]|uniref:DUF47 domain-containing protein n=1 Tax=unclassified Azospirillum TaxID=2630922 RepID=UPI003F4A4938
MEKTRIIDVLGEDALRLPGMLNEALAANDRAKYGFALFQTAVANAARPDPEAPTLAAERVAAGIDDDTLDGVVAACRQAEGGFLLPGAAGLHARLVADVARMLAPLERAGTADAAALRQRCERLLAALPAPRGDTLDAGYVPAIASTDRAHGDSLHLLVMDLHKALNALQTRIAGGDVDGASVYGLLPDDEPLVRAFMRGLHRTGALKFDHPGLGTTATRSGGRLILQNDIGTTDAHVLVVHVEDLAVTVTYTDVHLERLLFLQSLLGRFAVAWDDARTRRAEGLEDQGLFHLTVGTHRAADRDGLESYLAFLASRLVFLIDWNRARKRLRPFVGKKAAVAVLAWAAENDVGHRGFLEMGGERLLYDAITAAADTPLQYGETLAGMVGEARAVEFLKFVLRICAEGLLRGRSEALIREEVTAELITCFKSVEEGLVGLVAEHAALIVECAQAVRDALLRAPHDPAGTVAVRLARRAKTWESRADRCVTQTRALLERGRGHGAFRPLLENADDAIDGLEETAFLLTLLPEVGPAAALCPVQQELAGLLVDAAQEYVKAVEAARHVRRGGAREDLTDFLEAVDRIVTLERRTDDVHRRVKAGLLRDAADFRQLHLFTETARTLEEAADALMRAALILRDHVLGDVMKA